MRRLLTRNRVLVTLCAVLSLTAIYWQGRAAGGGAPGERISVGAIEAPRPENAFKAGNAPSLSEHARVTITEIRNLYRPDNMYEAGYTSGPGHPFANLGRIYTNRAWGPDNPTTQPVSPPGSPSLIPWSPYDNYIEITVTVAGAIEGQRVRWTFEDPDDPTDEQASWDYHYTWRVDPNDCVTIPSEPPMYLPVYPGTPGDNSTPRPTTLPGSRTPVPWEELTGYALSVPAGDNNAADTEILVDASGNGTSKVRFNVNGVAGDNYIVHASVVDAWGTPQNLGEDQTGIMTVWHMIYLEVGYMTGAGEIDLKWINDRFATACITLIQPWPRHSVPTTQWSARPGQPWADGDDILRQQIDYCNDGSNFTHKGPGVLFLVEALRNSPAPPANSPGPQVIWPPPTTMPTGGPIDRSDHWTFTPEMCRFYESKPPLQATIRRPTTDRFDVEVSDGVDTATGNVRIAIDGESVVVPLISGATVCGTVRISRWGTDLSDSTLAVTPHWRGPVTLPATRGASLTLLPAPTTRPGVFGSLRLFPELLWVYDNAPVLAANDWQLSQYAVDGTTLDMHWDKWYGLENPSATGTSDHPPSFLKDLMDCLEPGDVARTGTYQYQMSLQSEGDWQWGGMTMSDWDASIYHLTDNPNPRLLFTGRCIIFTQTLDSWVSPSPGDTLAARKAFLRNSTALHELGHCFGMAHNCGNWDWRNSYSTTRSACVELYANKFPLDAGDGVWQPQHPFGSARPVIPWPSPADISFSALDGGHFCAEHIEALRRAQLSEDGISRLLNWWALP
jgi:hypothetical protein